MTSPPSGLDAGCTADYFDGRSARPRRVRLLAQGGRLHIFDDAATAAAVSPAPLRSVAYADIRWPERTRHGARIAHLAGGGELHALGTADWDELVAGAGLRESFVVRSQQSWRAVLAFSVLLLALVAAGWRWGVPLLADATLAVLPASVDAQIGEIAFQQAEARWLAPSKLPAARQTALRSAFDQAVRSATAGERPAPYRLEFRAADIGPNAFALPGGTIVMTDELVEMVEGDEAAVLGVLAHEYGHVRGRHGMRQLVQATLLGAAGSLAFGDFSGLLAAAPALLGTLGYSRQLEREADAEAIALLLAAGRDPAAMAGFFERLARWRAARGETPDDSVLGIAFSSHPADAERIERFRAAARH